MVSPAITLAVVLIAGVLFFSAGGISRVRGFAEGFLPMNNNSGAERKTLEQDKVSIPTLQTNLGTVPVRGGSLTAVSRIEESPIIRLPVESKRKFNPQTSKPKIKTVFFNPKQGGARPQAGTTQFSTGESFNLSKGDIAELRSRAFTAQELEDIERLAARNIRKGERGVRPELIRDPEEIVFTKRQQEALARRKILAKFGSKAFTEVGGATTASGHSLGITKQSKLFAKPNFEFGGVSRATFERQQREKAAQRVREQENFARAQKQTELGREVARIAGTTKQSQKIFLGNLGFNLQGGALNARALGRLAEEGLI